MRTVRRLQAIERRREEVFSELLETMSDEELARLAGTTHPAVDRWLRALTDEELNILIDGKPGLSAIIATAPREYFDRRPIA